MKSNSYEKLKQAQSLALLLDSGLGTAADRLAFDKLMEDLNEGQTPTNSLSVSINDSQCATGTTIAGTEQILRA